MQLGKETHTVLQMMKTEGKALFSNRSDQDLNSNFERRYVKTKVILRSLNGRLETHQIYLHNFRFDIL